MRFWAIVLAIVLVMMALGAGGCESIAKKAVESATGVSVDESGDSVTITGEDGSMEINSEEGQLAADFPTEVPLYEGTIRDSAGFKTDTAATYTATIGTSDSLDDVKAFYEGALAKDGWKVVSTSDFASGEDRMVSFAAENADWSVSVTGSLNDGETEVVVMVGTKQQ
jgi:hypothetical protein